MNRDGPWKLGRKAMLSSLVVAHVWGTLLIIAVLRGNNSSVIGEMFAAVGFMIFSILGVLVGGKSWKDFAALRWGQQSTRENNYGDGFMDQGELEGSPDLSDYRRDRMDRMEDFREGRRDEDGVRENRGSGRDNPNREETE